MPLALRKRVAISRTMLGRLYEGQECSIARALELVGERWSLLILRDAIFRRTTRFTDFERALGIAPNILAKRLESFVEAGLMHVSPREGGAAPRYLLTPRGEDFKAALIAITAWGDQWIGPGPVEFVDSRSGERVSLRLVSEKNGDVVDAEHISVRLR